MSKKENLKDAAVSNQNAAKRMLDDINEEESLNTARGLCNHIKWQVGHLIYCVDVMIRLLGGDKIVTDEWVAPYKGGVELSEDVSVYPPFDELRSKYYDMYDQFNKKLEKSTDAQLDEVVELSPEWKETSINGIFFFLKHEFYHLGQISIVRKALGRERAFG